MGGLVVSGGRVVDPASGMDAVGDVAVVDGRIAAVGTWLGSAERMIDAMGPAAHRGRARSRDPEPSELHGPGPRVKTCSSSCLSWLHPLRSWSLRQARGGSLIPRR